jgi:hypothetical protein
VSAGSEAGFQVQSVIRPRAAPGHQMLAIEEDRRV